MSRKRERENPCFICSHYHNYEAGEPCGVCGHGPACATARPAAPPSAFPTEVLPSFLYLGSYDHASRAELLKAMGIRRILNVRAAQRGGRARGAGARRRGARRASEAGRAG
jgi:dual specificity MAP kinase phosphatase